MKREYKFLIGITVWLLLGAFSTVVNWSSPIMWVIGTYVYITFVEPFEKEIENERN